MQKSVYKMGIENDVRKLLKNTGLTWKRVFLKVILGEFNRINDGKQINDTQCMGVIKKLIKNSKELLKIDINDELAIRELEYLNTFLPTQATENDMIFVIGIIIDKNKDYKNVMQLMKPCIDLLEKNGLDVDKNKLSKILKEY